MLESNGRVDLQLDSHHLINRLRWWDKAKERLGFARYHDGSRRGGWPSWGRPHLKPGMAMQALVI